jgi:hypothetical protein
MWSGGEDHAVRSPRYRYRWSSHCFCFYFRSLTGIFTGFIFCPKADKITLFATKIT